MNVNSSLTPSIDDSAEPSENTQTHEVFHDYIPPTTVLTSSLDTVLAPATVTFFWTATDDTTPASDILFSYRLDPTMDSWSPWTHDTSVVFSSLQPGLYLFQIYAQDSFGNQEQKPVRHSFKVLSPQQELTENNNTKQTYYYSWVTQKKYIFRNDSFFVSKKISWEKTLNINDANIDDFTIILSWKDDFSASMFHLGEDVLSLYVFSSNSTCIFSQSSQGAGMLVFSLKNITHKPENGVLSAVSYQDAVDTLSSLQHTTWVHNPLKVSVSCRIRDLRPFIRWFRDKGNSFSLNISYTFYALRITDNDTTPPETVIMQHPAMVSTERIIEFVWQGTDDFTNASRLVYQYQLDGYDQAWSSWTKTTSRRYIDLPVGSYVFSVRGRDIVGNIDPTPATYAFTIIAENNIDTTPPETILVSGPEDVVQTQTITFSWTGIDDQTALDDLVYSFILWNYSIEWSSWGKATSITIYEVPEGWYLFEVRARDRAGNIDPTPAQRRFQIHQSPLNRFASQIIEFQPGVYGSSTATKILGGPRGKGATMGSTDVVVLGLTGRITVGFDVVITDKPGYDFIVFENPFFIGSTSLVFAELVHVEVSTDGVNFARFPGISTTAQPVLPYRGIHPENCTRFAGVKPVYANIDDNTLDPFNPSVAGGDPFDLADLFTHPLVQAGIVDLERIHFIRLIDVQGDGTEYDAAGNPIYDSTGGGINGADIDAIAVLHFSAIT